MHDVLLPLLRGGLITIELTLGSWALAVVAGLLLAVLRQAPILVVRIVMDVLITCLRGIPQLVLMYLIFYGLSQYGVTVGPLTAAIAALGVAEAGFTSEAYRGALATVGTAPREAARSLGMRPFDTFRLVTGPIALRFAIPPLLNSFVSLLKLATLASAVGVEEILSRSQTIINQNLHLVSVSLTVAGLYLLFTLPLTRAVGRVERRMFDRGGAQAGPSFHLPRARRRLIALPPTTR
jgi:His/Glu/Gln/Arg/opine family amino acid ABC transporter permease subunit